MHCVFTLVTCIQPLHVLIKVRTFDCCKSLQLRAEVVNCIAVDSLESSLSVERVWLCSVSVWVASVLCMSPLNQTHSTLSVMADPPSLMI